MNNKVFLKKVYYKKFKQYKKIITNFKENIK